MALVLADRVRETTTTTGTGTVTLAGAVFGYQTFSAIGNGNTTYYCIAARDLTEWEVGIGTYTSSGTTLARTTILSSSNAGAAVNFSAGTKDVFVTYPSEKSVNYEQDGGVVISDNGTNAALRITQLGAGNALLVEDAANPDATPFVVAGTGEVLVGTTSGIYDSSGSVVVARTAGGKLSLGREDTSVVVDDNLGEITFQNKDNSTGVFRPSAYIGAYAEGTFAPDNTPSYLIFGTAPVGSESVSERMRISSSGQFTFTTDNMTTPNPSAFQVNTTAKAAQTGQTVGLISAVDTDATYAGSSVVAVYADQGTLAVVPPSQYGFVVPSGFNGGTNNYAFYSGINAGTGRWNFYANGTADNYFAGDVGIGITTPVTKLEVSGSNNTAWSATSTSISGTTMTIAGTVTGTIAIGDIVHSTGMQPYTRITAGSGLSWTVSVSQTFASATVVGGASYGNTVIRITDADTSVSGGQPNGALQFFVSDTSAPTAGVSAYVAALAEDTTPDTALVFGTRSATGGGVDANERMRITSGGIVTLAAGSGLSVSATTVTAPDANDGNVFSGTYTPVQVSTNTNIATGPTFSACQYMRVGTTVTVSGQIVFTATASATDTIVKISLPIASDFSATRQLAGTGAAFNTGIYGTNNMALIADSTNNCVEMRNRPTTTASTTYSFTFTYQVL
jgi:hypothetical protein